MTHSVKHKYVYITYRPASGLTPHSLDLIHEWIKSHTPRTVTNYAETVEFTDNPQFTRAHWHCTLEFYKPIRLDNNGFTRTKLFPEAATLQGLLIQYPATEATFMRHTGYIQKEQSTLFKSNMNEAYLQKCYELYEQWQLARKSYEYRSLPDIVLTRNNQMQYFRQIMKEEQCTLVKAITDAINSRKVVFQFINYKMQWRMEHEAPYWTESMTRENLLEQLTAGSYPCDGQCFHHHMWTATEKEAPAKKRKIVSFSDLEQGVQT